MKPRPRRFGTLWIGVVVFACSAAGESFTVYVSKNADGVVEFVDRRHSPDDATLTLDVPAPVEPGVAAAQMAQQLAIAEALAASRHDREKLRLQRQTLALERRREERRIIEAEARYREAANYRSWYRRPIYRARHYGYRRYGGHDESHPPGGYRPPGRPPGGQRPGGGHGGDRPAPVVNTSPFFPGPGR